MATKDERPSLLSKVALFVRNPTKDWSELDRPSQRDENGYDKQALQAMMERKRQNDFVRRREFDHLRKLRNRNPIDTSEAAANARTSYFQNSVPTDSDGRAVTLKKIDEIEAQMSKQWWKGKGEGDVPTPASRARADTVPISQLGTQASGNQTASAPASQPAVDPYGPTQPFPLTPVATSSVPNDYPVTQMSDALSGVGMTPSVPYDPAAAANVLDSEFTISRLFTTQQGELVTDPELEEAAIRFANGDADGAEKSLVNALQTSSLSPAQGQAWAGALFDLYRATGRRADFESAVATYQIHCSGIHPTWVHIGSNANVAGGVGSASASGSVVWNCPAQLTESEMQALQDFMASQPMPWNFNWSQLQAIHEDALRLLNALFASLSHEPVTARFVASDHLIATVRSSTAKVAASLQALAWELRFNLLRALNEGDAFDHLSIEYCVANAAEAPIWFDPLCRVAKVAADELQDHEPDTAPQHLSDDDGLSALRGEILGDANEVLQGLLDFQSSGDLLLVGCSELQRVDFAAAGSILNWVVARENEGRQVQFHNVHRLVAAFFNVIGINEHARVISRAL